MKKLALIILMAVLAYGGQAQTVLASKAYTQSGKTKAAANAKVATSNIPSKAKEHFTSKHGNAEKRVWNTEGDGGYRTNYKENGKEYTARYSKTGQWISDERHLQEHNIPLPILEAFKASKYHYGHIDAYSFVKNESYTRGVYVLTVTLGSQQTCLYYSAAGKLLRTF